MANTTTIARPYAKAVFELAQESKTLTQWSDQLNFLSAIVQDSTMKVVIKNPKMSQQQLVDLFSSVGESKLSPDCMNLVKMLIQNGRLIALPDIAMLFDEFKADAEKTVHAEVVSAVKMDDEHKQTISSALKKRLGREVELTCTVDESLLGGAIIRAGDLVIDGSVVGRLGRLANQLAH